MNEDDGNRRRPRNPPTNDVRIWEKTKKTKFLNHLLLNKRDSTILQSPKHLLSIAFASSYLTTHITNPIIEARGETRERQKTRSTEYNCPSLRSDTQSRLFGSHSLLSPLASKSSHSLLSPFSTHTTININDHGYGIHITNNTMK